MVSPQMDNYNVQQVTTSLAGLLILSVGPFPPFPISEPTVQYGGELILGGIDTQLFTGEIAWVPVIQHPYWQINIEEFAIGNQATGWGRGSCPGIVDTGKFFLTIPQQYLRNFLQAVKAPYEDSFVVDCNNIQNIPTIIFYINGSQFPLPPSA
ncbi:gastricsin-like, partial [Python bivittatus]|uniref:Gastricsin-like n=1 Tax=Python bivittatus TaxID=176946 RepID=A0A9F5JCS8_PYTBI